MLSIHPCAVPFSLEVPSPRGDFLKSLKVPLGLFDLAEETGFRDAQRRGRSPFFSTALLDGILQNHSLKISEAIFIRELLAIELGQNLLQKNLPPLGMFPSIPIGVAIPIGVRGGKKLEEAISCSNNNSNRKNH